MMAEFLPLVDVRDVDFDGMNAKIRVNHGIDFDKWMATSQEDRKKWWVEDGWAPTAGETREAFIDRHYSPWATFGFLGLDGVWRERQSWDGEKFTEQPKWIDAFRDMLAAVPDNARISVVDIHT